MTFKLSVKQYQNFEKC